MPPQPPGDDEKYSYIRRNLPYLTTVILIGSTCLIISQVRFETHDPALLPFIAFTAIFGPLADHSSGRLLVEDPSIAEYYLPAGS